MAATQTSEQGSDKRVRILQAAEKAFAQEGYHGTTMRRIADEADAKLSLVVYHFETKFGLYRELFSRRQYLNERRLDLLRAVNLKGGDAIAMIVNAFADPILELHDSPTDVWYARLVLREASDPSSHDRGIIHEFFDPMAVQFIDAISQANPGRSPDFYRWAYLFAVGVLTSSAYDERVIDLAGALGAAEALQAREAPKALYLKEFIANGWASRR